ncbi:MAG: energy-coupling factor transporter transmembrane protein EcfT, partial [Desulfobacteraceae bacterium]
NPFKRIIRIGIPLFRKIFQSADRLVMAMEARSFQEDRTDPQFSSSGKETIAFAAGICLFCIIILV